MRIQKNIIGGILCLLAIFSACKSPDKSQQSDKLQIVCTTGMIGDAVQNIVDTLADVKTLMGPGVDPHLYKATLGDIDLLSRADVILYNGLHLEGKMGEVFEQLSRQKTVIPVSDALDKVSLLHPEGYDNAFDPHIWFDVSMWSQVIMFISKKLGDKHPEYKDLYFNNAKNYVRELKKLHIWAREEVQRIPEEQRVLITAHDAFEYFGRAYKIEVRGLQGISTLSEFGIKDIQNLTAFIAERKINAVFVESSVSPKALEAVVEGCKAKGHDVRIGGTLFSDAMGEKGTPEGTYIGMVRHNVEKIVLGLK